MKNRKYLSGLTCKIYVRKTIADTRDTYYARIVYAHTHRYSFVCIVFRHSAIILLICKGVPRHVNCTVGGEEEYFLERLPAETDASRYDRARGKKHRKNTQCTTIGPFFFPISENQSTVFPYCTTNYLLPPTTGLSGVPKSPKNVDGKELQPRASLGPNPDREIYNKNRPFQRVLGEKK